MTEKLYFEKLEEHIGKYFVEYHPPAGDAHFATLNITLLEDEPAAARSILEEELGRWLLRYGRRSWNSSERRSQTSEKKLLAKRSGEWITISTTARGTLQDLLVSGPKISRKMRRGELKRRLRGS